MKTTAAVVLAFLLCAAGCGKVANPLPPIIRIPQPVTDLAVAQAGYNAVLSWTNPARFVDDNAADDLSGILVTRNGVEGPPIALNAAGQRQSLEIDMRGSVGVPQTFAVRIQSRRGRQSAMSNLVTLQPVDAPGAVRNLRAQVDRYRIRLDWDLPELNPGLASYFVLSRTDPPFGTILDRPFYEDQDIEVGKTYTYSVTAARQADGGIPGTGGASVRVEAVDRSKPRAPSGLRIQPIANGAFILWDENDEEDLEGYFVYRGENPDGAFVRINPEMPHPTSSFSYAGYQPGAFYKVSAVDVFGNESDPSGVLQGP